MKPKALLILLSILTSSVIYGDNSASWQALFNGENLDGWTRRGGTAEYHIDGDTIVGATTEGSANTFLCTDQIFGNFELILEVKVDDALNSGIQIRSRENDQGRVNGPQVEIEASPGQAAYIYGEAMGTGWLSPEPKAPGGELINHHHAFKNNEWNTYRILAEGSTITTFLNDILVTKLDLPEAFASHPVGFIGLQVHSIHKGSGPYQVRWKNIQIRPLAE